jgi:hypothetical protein
MYGHWRKAGRAGSGQCIRRIGIERKHTMGVWELGVLITATAIQATVGMAIRVRVAITDMAIRPRG